MEAALRVEVQLESALIARVGGVAAGAELRHRLPPAVHAWNGNKGEPASAVAHQTGLHFEADENCRALVRQVCL